MEKTVHKITLSTIQAQIWEETCQGLGLKALRREDTVWTFCTDADRTVAWELFKEEFEKLFK